MNGILNNDQYIHTIGQHFEQSLSTEERKNMGQYYTDQKTVQFILKLLKITPSSNILDPTCGCGSFLIGVQSYLNKKFNCMNIDNIHGVDLNKKAVSITRNCLKSDLKPTKKFMRILNRNILYGNSITSNTSDKLSLDFNKTFCKIMSEGGFDFIIGNPPYGMIKKNEFNIDESNYADVCNGHVNKASLILVKSLDLLKNNGKMAFVLPKSLTFVSSYSKLREYLLSKSVIFRIHDLSMEFPDVRGEQIILFIQKTCNKPHDVIISTHNKSKSELMEYRIKYTKFKKTRFPILTDKNHHRILEILDNNSKCTDLSSYISDNIFRGIALSNKEQQLITNNFNKKTFPIIRGKSIKKFNIKNMKYIKSGSWTEQNVTKITRLSNPKIVLQNIFSAESGSIAAFDSTGLLNMDTITNILVPNDKIGFYLLALLHSKLFNFYLIFGLFNISKLTMHTDRSYMGKIPIIENIDSELIKLAKKAKNTINEKSLKILLKKIDDIVFNLYEINHSDVKIINNAINGVLSKRSRW